MAFRFGTGPAADAYGAAGAWCSTSPTSSSSCFLSPSCPPSSKRARRRETGLAAASTVINLVLICSWPRALSFFFAPRIIRLHHRLPESAHHPHHRVAAADHGAAIIILPVSSPTCSQPCEVFDCRPPTSSSRAARCWRSCCWPSAGVPALAIGGSRHAGEDSDPPGGFARPDPTRPTVELKSPTVRTVGIWRCLCCWAM